MYVYAHIGICYKNMTIFSWLSWLSSLWNAVIYMSEAEAGHAWGGSQEGQMDVKLGRTGQSGTQAHELEPRRRDWNWSQYMLPLSLVVWMSCRSRVLLYKHTYLAQVTEQLKKDPEDGAVTSLAAASPQPGEPADRRQCVCVTEWLPLDFHPPDLP